MPFMISYWRTGNSLEFFLEIENCLPMPQSFFKPFFFFAASVFLLVLHACEKPEDLGRDVLPSQDDLHAHFSDSLTVHAFSYDEDPIRTSMRQRILIGSYYDPVFGQIHSSLFTQLRMPSTNLDFGPSPEVDSVILSLSYTGFYGDTSQQAIFKVYELQESLSGDTAYYSDDQVAHSRTPLGQKQFYPRPTTSVMSGGDTLPAMVRIPLNNHLAQRFFQAGSGVFVDNSTFLNFFKGIHVRAQTKPSDGAILYFNPFAAHSIMTIYYRSNGDTLQASFHMGEESVKFNRYTHDYSTANIDVQEQVIQKDTLPPTSSLFIQSMGGISVRIRFPYLDQYRDKDIALNKATLVVKADPSDASSDTYKEPPRMGLVTLNDEGELELLTDYLVSAELFDGYYDNQRKEYRFTITRHIQERLNGEPDYGLVMVSDQRALNANRVALKGPQHPDRPMRLELIYTRL